MRGIGSSMLLMGAVVGIAWPGGSAKAALNSINIFKNTLYLQTSGSAPTTPDSYFFNAGTSSDTANEFDTASVGYPGPDSPQALDPDPKDPTAFGFGS